MNNSFNKLQNGTNRAVYSLPFSLQYLRDLKLILPRKVKKQIATITDGFISQARRNEFESERARLLWADTPSPTKS